jgi:biopolymer transport protein ExbB/TolQ
MHVLAHHFEEGGWGMYPVLACSVVAWTSIIAHLIRLYRPRPRTGEVLGVLQRHLSVGDLEGAVQRMAHTRGEVARVAVAGLSEGIQHPLRIEAAITARHQLERAPLRQRLRMLLCTGQIATLCGLLGAVTGLYGGFGCHNADAASRATMLAAAISESMNCTAFGILVSIVALGAWWVFDTRADVLSADLAHAAHAIQAMLITYRDRLRWLGERPEVVDGTYRTTE